MHILPLWVQKIAHSCIGLHAFVILHSCKLCSFGSCRSLSGRSHRNPWCFGDKPEVLFSPIATVELTYQNSTVYSVGKRTEEMCFHAKCASSAHQSCPHTPSLHVPYGISWCRGHPRGGCQQLPLCPWPARAHALTGAVPNGTHHRCLPPALSSVPAWISSLSSDAASCVTSGAAITSEPSAALSCSDESFWARGEERTSRPTAQGQRFATSS